MVGLNVMSEPHEGMSVLGRYCVNEHYGIVLGERSLLSLAIIIAQETGS